MPKKLICQNCKYHKNKPSRCINYGVSFPVPRKDKACDDYREGK